MNLRIVPILGVGLLAIVAGGYAVEHERTAARERAQQQGRSNPPGVPVVVATAEQRDFPILLRGLGAVQAFNTVTVTSRVDGQIVAVAFKEGQMVHAGDLLVQIDPRPFQTQLNQAEATLARDQAQLANAELDLRRSESLLSRGFTPHQQYDTQRATVAQLQATLKADEAAIENAKLQLAYATITSPIDGRTGARLLDLGNQVHAGDVGGLVVVTQMQPIFVSFTVPERSLGDVRAAMAREAPEVQAYASDDRTRLATGQLTLIDNLVDQASGTLRLKAVFENQDSVLWPGQFINARLVLAVQKDGTVVPAPAIQVGPDGNFVFAVKPDGTVERRDVKIAETLDEVTLVVSGAAPGDKVVVEGQFRLTPGARVTILDDRASPAAVARSTPANRQGRPGG
jgi:multidrug efflux system membrane fusion protein